MLPGLQVIKRYSLTTRATSPIFQIVLVRRVSANPRASWNYYEKSKSASLGRFNLCAAIYYRMALVPATPTT